MALKSQSAGKRFEKRIKIDAKARGHHALNVPEKVIGTFQGKATMLKSPYDFALCYKGLFVAFDAKWTSQKNLNIKSSILGTKRSGKHSRIHQLNALCEVQMLGGIGGYLIGFERSNEAIWVSAKDMNRLVMSGEKSIGFDTIPNTPIVSLDTIIDFNALFLKEADRIFSRLMKAF